MARKRPELFSRYMAGATRHCCRLGAHFVYTVQLYASSQCHFIRRLIRRVHACSGVTCRLHFWQNDRDILPATAVIRGWNVYPNKSQHGRKLTLEKKILPPFLLGLEPETFRSQVRHSTTELSIPADPFMSSWLVLANITETIYYVVVIHQEHSNDFVPTLKLFKMR